MLEFPTFFAPLCVLAGACRIVGISNVFARLSAPGHRSGRVVMAQTRKTLGDSNNSGAHAGRIRPYMLEPQWFCMVMLGILETIGNSNNSLVFDLGQFGSTILARLGNPFQEVETGNVGIAHLRKIFCKR